MAGESEMHRKSSTHIRLLAALAAVALVAGCGRNGLVTGATGGSTGSSSAEVDVTVTVSGQPDSGALVQLVNSSQSPVGEEKTDDTGVAVFQNVTPGSGYTAIATDGGNSGEASGILVTAGKTLASIQLVTGGGPAGLVTGSVVNASTQAPLAGVKISAGGQSATSDSSGQFQLPDVPAGSEVVNAQLNGYNSFSETVIVKSGTSNAISLQLQPQATGPKAGHTLITTSTGVTELDPWSDVVAHYSASEPFSAVFEPNGDVLVADGGGNEVSLFGTTGTQVTSYTGRSWWQMGIGGISDPHGASLTPNNTVLVADTGHDQVVELNGSNQKIWSYSSGLSAPQWAERLPSGDTLIADTGNNRIIEVNPSGSIVWALGGGTNIVNHPDMAQRLSNGDTLVCDSGNNRVMEINPQDMLVWMVGAGSQMGNIQLNNPSSARRLATGNTLIADTGNNRVIEVDQSGNIVWQAQAQQPVFADRF